MQGRKATRVGCLCTVDGGRAHSVHIPFARAAWGQIKCASCCAQASRSRVTSHADRLLWAWGQRARRLARPSPTRAVSRLCVYNAPGRPLPPRAVHRRCWRMRSSSLIFCAEYLFSLSLYWISPLARIQRFQIFINRSSLPTLTYTFILLFFKT